MRLSGVKTPKFTTMDNSSVIGNVSMINLGLNVTSYSVAGNWITGTTVIMQQYSHAGPHSATFSGCCVSGLAGNTDFSILAKVDMSTSSFAPAIVPVAAIYAEPGRNFTLPAQHPRGILGPVAATSGANAADFYRYGWTLVQGGSGVMVDAVTGNVAVPLSANVGQMIWVVARVSVLDAQGSPLPSHSSIALMVSVMAAGGAVPGLPSPAGLAGVNEMSRRYEVRTGFKFTIAVSFGGFSMPSSGDAFELYTNERLPAKVSMQMVPVVAGQAPSRLVMMWDRPCGGDEQAIDLCFAAREISTGRYTPQMCISIRVLMDIPPGFLQPVQQSFAAMMGKETSFMVMVQDAAAEDQVTALRLAEGYSLPTGAFITGRILSGNSGQLIFSWTPLPSDGGGQVELCFIATDIPASTYDQCRGGSRSSTKCVSISVARCRYVVRDRETISDVASLFATDWVQLWALNPSIYEPDYEVGLSMGTVLNTGHAYKVDSGDYLNAIAFKFGTTLKHLLMLNADLSSTGDAVLDIGTQLCVIPNSCIRD